MLELTTSPIEKHDSSQSETLAISIITATFNASNQIPGLIDSLRSQSDRDFEWIVVDGSSTDATIDLLEASGDLVSTWMIPAR